MLAGGTASLAEAMLPKLFAPATLARQGALVAAQKSVILGAPPEGVAAALP